MLIVVKQCLLLKKLVDVVIEPEAVKQLRGHVFGASNDLLASGLTAKAFEWLGHVPFGRGIEELCE